MKKLTQEEIDEMVRLHGLWLNKDAAGIRANFSGMDLEGVNLAGRDLRLARLENTNLRYANLENTRLDGANLEFANLSEAKMARAKLGYANLYGANLAMADLNRAILISANLYRANLGEACLYGAFLKHACLGEANLTSVDPESNKSCLKDPKLIEANLSRNYMYGSDFVGANLRFAKLEGAGLVDAKIAPEEIAKRQFVPPIGTEFTVWTIIDSGVICKLLVPADAKRSNSLTSRKCRVEFAKVLEGEGTLSVDMREDTRIRYKVGEIVRGRDFEDGNGICCFLTREEAENYYLLLLV